MNRSSTSKNIRSQEKYRQSRIETFGPVQNEEQQRYQVQSSKQKKLKRNHSIQKHSLSKSDIKPSKSQTHQYTQRGNQQISNNVYEEISSMTKSKLGELLLTVAEEEIAIEKLRQNLASFKEFEPYSAFTRIDRDQKNCLYGKDIAFFIKQNGQTQLFDIECNYLIKYFDSEFKGFLDYTEFMSVILPCDDAYLRAATTQRPSKRILPHQYLEIQVEKAIAQLLEREVKFHLQIEYLKKDLENCKDFNERRAFKAIDESGFKYISEQSLKQFFRRMGHQCKREELVAILRRFDLDGDSKISFQEFVEGLKPVSPEIIPIKQRNQTIESSPLKQMKLNQTINQDNSQFQHNPDFLVLDERKNHKKSKKKHKSEEKTHKKRKHHHKKSKIRDQQEDYTQNNEKQAQDHNNNNHYHHHHHRHNKSREKEQEKQTLQSFVDESPMRITQSDQMNKSVTFNNQVKIREFENAYQKQSQTDSSFYNNQNLSNINLQNCSPLRQKSPPNNKNTQNKETPQKLISPDFKYQDNSLSSKMSPLRIQQKDSAQQQEKLQNPSPQNQQYQELRKKQELFNLNMQKSNGDINNSQKKPSFSVQKQVNQNIIEEIIKLFRDQMYLEKEIEKLKTEFVHMSWTKEFSSIDVFKEFDKQNKGYLNLGDLREQFSKYLEYNSMTSNISDDIYLIFKRYDRDGDGKISYAEFCSLFASKYNLEQMYQSPSKSHSRTKSGIESEDCINLLKNLLKAHINLEQAHEYLRHRLRKSLQKEGLGLSDLFRFIDKEQKGFINQHDIEEIMKLSQQQKRDERSLNEDLFLVIQKFDKIEDKRITYLEFIDELTPKQL